MADQSLVSGVAADSLGATRLGDIAFAVATRTGVSSILVDDAETDLSSVMIHMSSTYLGIASYAKLLASLEARDLIRLEPVSRFPGQQQFRIKHALIRDVAYAALPRAKRRDAHAAVAAFFEELHGEHDSPAGTTGSRQEKGNAPRST